MRDNLGRFVKGSPSEYPQGLLLGRAWNKGKIGLSNNGGLPKGHKQYNTGRTWWTKEKTQSTIFQARRNGKLPGGEKLISDNERAKIHWWMRKNFGTPLECEDCGTISANKFEWASIRHAYTKNRKDWKRLCTKCHKRFDWINRPINLLFPKIIL